MKRLIVITVTASLLFGGEAEAGDLPFSAINPTVNSSANATNQAQNQQNASGSVYATGGSQVNVQQNNQNANDYGFAPGVFCRTTTFNVGAFGSGNSASASFNLNSSAANYGLVMGLSIPIGGSIGDSCEQLAAEITKQRQLDTALNLIRQCALLKKEGISFNAEIFPEFSKCAAVELTANSKLKEEDPTAVFSPKQQPAIPVVPIR